MTHGHQSQGKYTPIGHPNLIGGSIDFSIFGGYAGGAVGLFYERFLNKEGTLSLGIAVKGYNAGTLTLSGYRTGQIETNVSGFYAEPGIFFHPEGNKQHTDLSFGIVADAGTIIRTDRTAGSSSSTDLIKTHDNFTALLARVNIDIHTSSAFVFGAHGSIGPILSAGKTGGLMVQLGITLGGRF